MYKISEIASVLVDAVISLGRNKASSDWVRTAFSVLIFLKVEVGQVPLGMFISRFGHTITV